MSKRVFEKKTFLGRRDEEQSTSVVLGVVIVCGEEVTERVFVGLTERFGAIVLRCSNFIRALIFSLQAYN